MISFDGRTVLVTGGGRGIGRAVCEYFGRKDANVLVNDIADPDDGPRPADEVVRTIREAGGTAVANYNDVSTMGGATDLVEAAVEEFGHLDVVYNNAGIVREATIEGMSEADFDQVLAVHLKGTFAVVHAAATWWSNGADPDPPRERAVINVSSDMAAGGHLDTFEAFGMSNYAMAKAGVLGFTRAAAVELDRYDARVNAIWPIAETRLSAAVPTEFPGPGTIAPLIAYLASEQCDFTGQTIRIAGDRLDLITPAPRPEATVYAGGDTWSLAELAERVPKTIGRHVTDSS